MTKTKKSRAVSLLSGGMDSCVTAKIASQSHELFVLHASYGQRTQARELKSFRAIARALGAAGTLEADLSVLSKIGASSLVDRAIDIPTEPLKKGGIPSTYVPFRNGILLATAAAWAESIGAGYVYIGAVAVDGAEGYPDTTRKFMDAFQNAVATGTRPETKIEIVAPLIDATKTEVVKKGVALGAPFELTWSCYTDDDIACGECLSCRGRMRAFEEAGVKDPIPYKEADSR